MAQIRALHWPVQGTTDQMEPALAGQGAAMKRLPIPAGHAAARHHHPFEQFLFVASGGGMLQHEAGELPLTPGTAVHLPAGAWHSAQFSADTVLIEINMPEISAA